MRNESGGAASARLVISTMRYNMKQNDARRVALRTLPVRLLSPTCCAKHHHARLA